MRGKMRKSAVGILAAVMGSVTIAIPSYAATLSSVVISLRETRAEAGEVWDAEPVISGMGCEIEDYEWDYDRDSWKPGRKVSLTVTVSATEGNSFSNSTNVLVMNGEKSTAKRKGSSYTVTINYMPKVQLATPTGIRYEDETTLCWEEVQYAGGYEIRIDRDGQYYKTVSVTGKGTEEYDLSEYITDDYLYTCSIRAVAPTGKSGVITASEWVDFDGDGVSMSGESTTAGEFMGSGAYRTFRDTDGNFVQGWQNVNGTWYYFDPDNYSYATTGVQKKIGGCLYSFDGEGRMKTGWIKEDNGYWYFYSMDIQGAVPFGAAKTGWLQTAPDSPWYFLNDGNIEGYPYGAMLTNTVTPDGYSVNENGEWVQG